MPDSAPIKILVVDDLPEKLLVYRSVLEAPDVELVMAHSGADALRHVLQDDFAVILLDVNMPDLDGYETAAMIRTRRRCAHTPIIFITAFADELHATEFQAPKGYSYGAVDYILSPVVPDVLRTKVRVFVDLYRLNQQVRAQAAQRVALVEREHAHLAALLEKATDFVGRVDVAGRLLHINRAGRQMLGLHDEDETVRRWFGETAKETSNESASPSHRFAVPEFSAASSSLCPLTSSALEIARREGVWFGEAVLCARDGREIPVSQVILAHKDESGAAESFSIIARDITERKRAEAELTEHRTRLEDLVRQRTTELEASHERLRLADRLASIGTLAAGLGHDMGNLLLPIRARLASLEQMQLPQAARDDIDAIKTAGDYLKRLSQGLRLFALDPTETHPHGTAGGTALKDWWPDVQPFLRNALPREVALDATFAPDLPPLAIAPHTFTQVVYNLVQNAGDAMRDRGGGRVTIGAALAHERPDFVLVRVSDDGPGMTEEVRRRCMEPFFTTRTRRISTGLGLALVRGAIGSAGGTIEIDSRLGVGTTFRMLLPVTVAAVAVDEGRQALTLTASVAFRDQRLGAYVTSLLRNLNVEVVGAATEAGEEWSVHTSAQLLVLEGVNGSHAKLEQFLSANEARRVLVIGAAPGFDHERIAWLDGRATPARIRAALGALHAKALQGGQSSERLAPQEVPG